MANQQPRTKGEAILEIKYQLQLHSLHQRLYRRLRFLVAFLSLALGSSAIVGIISPQPWLVAGAGIIIAALTIVDSLCQWSEMSARHASWRRDMATLLANSGDLDLKEIDRAIAHHYGEVDDEVRALSYIAYNDVVRGAAHEDWIRVLPPGSKFLQWIV